MRRIDRTGVLLRGQHDQGLQPIAGVQRSMQATWTLLAVFFFAQAVQLVSLGSYCGPKLSFQKMGRGAATLPFAPLLQPA